MPAPMAGYAKAREGPSRPTTPVPDIRRLGAQAGLPDQGVPMRPALDQSQLVKGQQLDYWSEYNRCWMPATITEVDNESGGICLNVKPNAFISRADQRRKVRARTIPRKEQVAMMQAILQQEKVEEVAEQIYVSAAGSKSHQVPTEQIANLGTYLDNLLGLVGSQIHLTQSARSESGLTMDEFKKVFWELLQMQQDISVQAIPRFSIESIREGSPWQKYIKGKELGHGTYGYVYLANDKHSKQVRAVKEISKEKLQGDMQAMKKEIENLTNLDHPHILKLYEVYSTTGHIYLVTDFCPGGELHSHISAARKSRQEIPETWIAEAMLQLMQAICHIHVRGIIHLDLKSQNIMLMPSQKTAAFFGKDAPSQTGFATSPHLIVIDLGIAMHFKPGDYRGNRPMGTPMTMAPEVWSGEITPEADVFSCGCVFFELLSGDMPFRVKFEGNFEDIVKFWRSKPRFAPVRASADAQDLLRNMLTQERSKRPSAAQCLGSAFLKKAVPKGKGNLDDAKREALIKRLATVHCRSVLYKNIALTIAQDWPPNQMPTFKQLFNELDVMGTGALSSETLEEALMKHGIEQAEATRATTAMNLSQDKAGIHWTEFVAACIDLSLPEFEPKIFKIFQDADKDRDNLLASDDLMNTFPQGHKYSKETAATIFRDLTGRDAQDKGARMDWSTFYGHLRSCALNGLDASLSLQSSQSSSQWSIFSGVVDAISTAASDYFSQKSPYGVAFPGEKAPQNMNEMLQALEEMGFKERELNRKIIKEKGGRLGDDVIEAIMQHS